MEAQCDAPPLPDRTDLLNALDVLERHGRTGFTDHDGVSRGQAIGYALFAACDVHVIFEAAVEALQQWNAHLLVAVLLALRRGQWGDHRGNSPHGSVTRRGRHVHVKLPGWWSDL
jgi:hypothetical protein